MRVSVGTISSVSGTTGTGAAGRVAYWQDATTLTSSASFTFDGTTMTAPGLIARNDTNGATRIQIRNDDAGASAYTQLKLTTDAGDINLTANSTAAGDSVSLTADSTFGGGMDLGILGANTLRLNTGGATRISASGAGLVSIGTVNGNEEHVANGRLSIVPQTNLPLKLTGNSSAGTITFANTASSGKYNWLIGGQYNINNAFEITPSTAVDGFTFSTPVVTITNNGLVSFTNNVTVTSSGGPQYVAKDGGSFGTNADPHIQFEDTTGSGGRIGFTDGASKDLKIQNQTDTGLFDFVTVATQIAGSAGAATGTYWTIKLGGTTYKLALLANA